MPASRVISEDLLELFFRTTEDYALIVLDPDALVLAVDDEAAIRSMVHRLLEGMGYTVLTAEHGGQALELMERSSELIMLVLLDLAMRVLAGSDTAAALQERRPDLPIIVMSGLADQEALRCPRP